MKDKKTFKEKIYAFTARIGVGVFQKIFPEFFAKEPLKPTDRYIEYPFAVRNLPKPPAKILDVGCAGSFFPLLLAGLGYSVFGIDLREYAIINRIKFDNFQFIKEDITKNSFPNDCFDAVTAISTVEHIGIAGRYGADDDLDADKKAIAEIKRMLKPGGILLLTVPFGKPKVIKPYHRIYDDNLINQLVEGFEIEKEEYCAQDSNDDWCMCQKAYANNFNSNSERYAVCLLKLRTEK